MRKKWLAAVLSMVLLLTGTAALADQKATIHGGWLLLRDAPSYQGRVLSSYPTGTVVSVTSQSGSWYEVTAPDGLQGYMLGSYLTISGGGGSLPAGSTGYVTSRNGLNVRMRTGPGLNYAVMASYAPGTSCTILGTENGWYKIQIGAYAGYMMSRYVAGTAPAPAPTPSPGTQADVWVISANGKGVYLREGAGKHYPSIGFYPVGTAGRALQFGSTWTYLQIGIRTGWMMTRFLTTVKPVTPVPPAPASGSYVISGNGRNVNLRSGPGTQFNALAAYPPGTALVVLTRGIQWDYVQINGMYGYMMRTFIHEGDANPAGISNEM